MAQDRILAQDINATMTSTVSAGGGFDKRLMSEIDKFDTKYVPDMLKTWPAGAKKYHHQLAGASYQTTMSGGQMGGGWLSAAAFQHQQVKLGNSVPQLQLVRKGSTKNNTFSETLTGGVISAATNSTALGNAAATTDITIEFEDMG